MTIEEARKVLDGELLVLTLENNVAREAQKKRLNEKFAALNMAVGAIDKQIPKKVIITTSTVRCSNCNKQLTNKGSLHSSYKFCKWCGQALDWSDTDD